MYVPAGEHVPDESWVKRIESGYTFKDGTAVKKIVTHDPLQVRDHRDEFSAAYESDIRFVQRMMIDSGLKSCFELLGRSSIVSWRDIKPVNKVILPLVVYLDIETLSRGRFPNIRNPVQPVIAITLWDTLYKKYLTIIVDTRYSSGTVTNSEPDWMVMHVATPRELTQKVNDYLNHIKGDIITGWNIKFDIDYMEAWLKRENELPLALDGYEIFDLISAYKKVRPSLGNRLKDVIAREGIATEEETVAKEYHVEHYLNLSKRDEFILYNKRDVEYCVKLDRGFTHVKTNKWTEYDLITNFWQQKNFAGLYDLPSTLSHAQRHDVLWLRKAHELGIVLPSQPKGDEDEAELEYGGVVFEPKPGVHEDLTILDMTRYYPSVLLSFPKETSPDIWGKIGPGVINDLSTERDHWDAELAKYTPGTDEYRVTKVIQTIVKHFLSGAWGFFAYSRSRIFDKNKGDFVLKTAGEGLRRLKQKSESIGHAVTYGDTDAIFARAKMDEVPKLVEVLNAELADWADDMGVESNRFRIKEDRYAKRTLFIRGATKDMGIKKRYGQWIVREDDQPCDYTLIKGFEYVRGNTSEVTRLVQKRVLDAALKVGTAGLLEYIRGEIEKVKAGTYDLDMCTIPVNLSMPFGGDIKRSGEYYTGAIYNNNYIHEGIVPGDMVRFFKVKSLKGLPPTEWLSYIDKTSLIGYDVKVDLDWVIERTIRSPLERILEAVGISWENVLGAENVNDLFR